MADRFIAIDSGKDATKVAIYDKDTGKTQAFKFKTKIGDGSFADDSLEKNTFIAEYDGNVYKIGNGAQTAAELTTSKASEVHKICVLTAIAMCCSENETDRIYAAIGIPVKEWEVVDKRNAYKDYILPEGKISITLKTKSDGPEMKKSFKVEQKFVFPESEGALFLDNAAEYLDTTAAVIDIGNLNINCTLWNEFELDRDASLTADLGANILISDLSQKLSAEFTRCSESYTAKVLSLPPEERYLHPTRPNPEIEQRSKELIKKHLLDHVRAIKRKCDARQWSLDYMKLVFIGGTSGLLREEIKEVFGEEVYIPEKPEYANVIGFLRILGTKTLGIMIPMPETDAAKTEAA